MEQSNQNETAVIIGGGPSVKDINLDLIKDKFVIGTNAAFYFGDWVDVCFFIDCRFHRDNEEALNKFPNRIITTCSTLKNKKGIEHYNKCEKCAICYHKDKLAQPEKGKNTGATAINLAIRLGKKRIILIGYDMQVVNGQHNYHNYHKHRPRDNIYDVFLPHFEKISKSLPKDVEVINANLKSALPYFKKQKIEDIIWKV
ncbi:MAG: DUF115 domain-containing protein [Spirochaetia bacterium]|nr:DUF115 domain-containing protein [Spirochaetia bacterium]